MNWSTKTWESIQETYSKITELPFIYELMNGSLSKERFLFYLHQDSVYLAEFGKVLAGIATKLHKAEHRETFLAFACDTVNVEQALHQTYLKETGNKDRVEASPACLLYTSYIHKQLSVASIEVAVASILPCFWIYKKVGDYILENQTGENNPYQEWINTYGGAEFTKAVEKAISICDELADATTTDQQEKMTGAFVMASKMEWMFWHSAYRKEKWLV